MDPLARLNKGLGFTIEDRNAGIDPKDIAVWVGNSAAVIYKHYAGQNKSLEVPEL